MIAFANHTAVFVSLSLNPVAMIDSALSGQL
jgi:hypothetical protein